MNHLLILGAFLISMNSWAKPAIPDMTPDLIRRDQLTQQVVLNGRVLGLEEEALNQSVHISLYSTKKKAWGGTCTGVVISKDAVLTAAHCVQKYDVARLRFAFDGPSNSALSVKDSNDIVRVRVSEDPLKGPSEAAGFFQKYCKNHGTVNSYYNGLNSLFFSDYKKNGYIHRGDLALIFYKGGLPKGVKIAQWYSGDEPKFQQKLYAYGYGRYEMAKVVDGRFREGISSVYGVVTEKLPKNEMISNGLISYSGDSFSSMTAPGDSGGGVFIKDSQSGKLKLLAITSGGIVTEKCGVAAQINLLINPYSGWIQRALESRRSQSYL